MLEWIIPLVLGILICVIGVFNTRGHINSLHWYHRQRVTEEDRLPFGRLTGAGMLTIGGSIILYSLIMAVYSIVDLPWLVILATTLMIVGVVVGLILSFYAMIKYNKGIF